MHQLNFIFSVQLLPNYIILSRKLPRKLSVCYNKVLPPFKPHIEPSHICAATQNNCDKVPRIYWDVSELLLHWGCVCSQQPRLFTRSVLLELTGPVKTETFRCPQFTFPASVCQQKGTRFLDSFNNSLFWPFAFSSHQTPAFPPSPSALSSVGRYRGPMRVWNSPPPRWKGKRSHRQSC